MSPEQVVEHAVYTERATAIWAKRMPRTYARFVPQARKAVEASIVQLEQHRHKVAEHKRLTEVCQHLKIVLVAAKRRGRQRLRKEAVKAINLSGKTPREQMYAVLGRISKATSVGASDIMGELREHRIVEARHAYWTVLMYLFRMGLAETGRHVGKDHSTVVHCRKKMANNPDYRDRIISILQDAGVYHLIERDDDFRKACFALEDIKKQIGGAP